jgi:probable rRNA maturation factor
MGSSSEIVVEVQIDEAFRHRARPELFTRSATAVLRHQGVAQAAELTIVLTGDDVVRELNRAYRGINAPTDVLAFGDEAQDDVAFATPPGAFRYLGDVIISYPRAEAQAREAGHPVEVELRLLSVHGVLHLLGHDHSEPDEAAIMWTAQSQILQELS